MILKQKPNGLKKKKKTVGYEGFRKQQFDNLFLV